MNNNEKPIILQLGRTQGKSQPMDGDYSDHLMSLQEAEKFFEIRRVPVPRMIITTPEGKDNIGDLMKSLKKAPYEFSYTGYPDTGMAVPPDFSKVKVHTDSKTDMVHDANLYLTHFLGDETAKKFLANANSCINEFMSRWVKQIRTTSKPTLTQAAFMRDLHILTVKEVVGKKPNFVPTNGPMRLRKHRHYAALIRKTIPMRHQEFKNAYPVNVNFDPAEEGGEQTVSVTFDYEPNFVADQKGKLSILSIDKVSERK